MMGEIDLRKGLCMGIDFILVTSIVVTGFDLSYFRAQIRLFGNLKQISAYFNKE